MSKRPKEAVLPLKLPMDADQASREFAKEVTSLTGLPFPPKNVPGWIALLMRAGFPQLRLEQALNFLGYAGFEKAGDLPIGYISAPATIEGTKDGNWPAFSAMLLEGLRKPQSAQELNEIPPQHRTRPMSYRKAASHLGKANSKDAGEWVSSCVRDGTLRCTHLSRQSHVFDLRQFPAESHSAIRATHPKSP